jgi:hypothetical protein
MSPKRSDYRCRGEVNQIARQETVWLSERPGYGHSRDLRFVRNNLGFELAPGGQSTPQDATRHNTYREQSQPFQALFRVQAPTLSFVNDRIQP